MPSRATEAVRDRARAGLARQALSCPAARAPVLLRRLGFKAPERALQILDRLAGPPAAFEPPPVEMLVFLARSGRPDRGLLHLERFVEAGSMRAALYARLRQSPRLAEYLARLLAHSNFMADILVRDPEWLYWLFEETPFLSQPLPKEQLRERLDRELAPLKTWEGRLRELLRVHRRELLRIGAAEVLGLKAVAQTGRELSDLADVVLEFVLEACMDEMVRRCGRPRDARGRPAHFCIVCLGKHGGQELNYSSDIDLLFVYDEEGRTHPRRGEAIDNHEFFTRLGEQLIRTLTRVDYEGFFYRVDLRLRPEGEHGPLARSLRSYWIYYETRGELWERQMLIKARRAAGARRLWRRFRDMLLPFVYPAHFEVRPQEEIGRIKARIEARMLRQPVGGNNIKLRPGGIRDIEFIVQCLQLLGGRVDPRMRAHNTLDALGRLERAGALSAGEVGHLRRAYCFFRRLENLLQVVDGRSLYAVPEDMDEQKALARLLGLRGAAELRRRLQQHCSRVRALYEALFCGEEHKEEGLGWLLEVEAGHPRALELLRECGFAAPEAAHRHVLQLAGAGGAVDAAPHLEACLPELLAALGEAPDPDRGMLRLGQIVAAYGAPGTFCEMLRLQPNFRRLLIALCASSSFLAELIQRHPALLDGLLAPPADEGGAAGGKGDLSALCRYHDQEVLRIGSDDLLGLVPQEETFLRLSEVAETILQRIWAEAWRRRVRRRGKPRDGRDRTARFVCLAGGKFGGRELNFGSDLDLFFVYEGEGRTGRTRTSNRVFFIEMAQEIVRLLQESDLYRVDARLRPEGRSAPMAIALPAYRRYLKERASTWERLALTRVRKVAGDEELGARVERAIQRFVHRSPVDRAFVDEVEGLRRRMEPAGGRSVDLKRGAGGIVDIEFIAQILIVHSGAWRRMRGASTPQALERLWREGMLAAAEGRALLAAYERFRQLEKGLRLASGQAADALPAGSGLRALARLVGPRQPEELLDEIEELMRRTRRLFRCILSGLRARE